MDDCAPPPFQSTDAPEGVSLALVDALSLLSGAGHGQLDSAIEASLRRLSGDLGARAFLYFRRSPVGWLLVHFLDMARASGSTAEAHAASVPPGLRLSKIVWDGTAGQALSPSILANQLASMGLSRTAVFPMTEGEDLGGVLILARADGNWTRTQAWCAQRFALALHAASTRQQAERARADESALQMAVLARMRATLAAMHELVLEFDEEGVCIDVHCTNPKLLKGAPEALLNRTLEETLPAEIAALQRDAMIRADQGGTAHIPVYRLEIDGVENWFSLTVSRRAAIKGRFGYVFVIRDITESHHQSAENERLGHVTRNMTNMAAILDAQGRIVWSNAALDRWLPPRAEAAAPLDYLETLDPETPLAQRDRIAAALARSLPLRAEVSRRQGSAWFDVNIQPLRDETGQANGFSVIETDVTERRAAEVERNALALQARAAKERLESAIDALPDAFAYFDGAGSRLFCNSPFEALADTVEAGIRLHGIDGVTTRSGEMTLNDGRTLRLMVRPTPDGGRAILGVDITEVKTAQVKLESIIARASIATWDHDLATRETRFHPHWYEMLGFARNTPELPSAQSWSDRWRAEDRATVIGHLKAIQAGEQNDLSTEIQIRHADGSLRYVMLRGDVSLRDPQGKAIMLSGVGIDVTERRQSEERLGMILRSNRVGTWGYDGRSGEVTIDEQYAAMLGYAASELRPFTIARFHALVHPEDRANLVRNTAQIYETGSDNVIHEYRIRHRDGSWRWMQANSRVLSWTGPHRPGEEIGVVFDITERREREAALTLAKQELEEALVNQRQTEQRLADIARATDDWFWEIDASGRVTYLSSGFERSTGIERGAVMGHLAKGIARLYAVRRDDDDRAATVPFASTRQDSLILKLPAQQGREAQFIRINGAPFFDDDGTMLGQRGVGSNVTAMMRATEMAEAANEAKSRFLANMSHELRTPLTAVLGMTEMLSASSLDGTQREMLDTIRGASEGLLVILNDILDLAKIEAGKLRIEAHPFTPATLMGRINSLFLSLAVAKGLDLRFEVSPACHATRLGDENRLRQILSNLISNAIKFTSTGAIDVHMSIDDNDGLCVTVTDTGIGMTEEQVARVFNEFEQAESSTTRRFGGTGLGLSITRHLTELMGGTLVLQSQPNAGTIVTLKLPLPRAEAPAPGAPVVEAATLDLGGLRILVADDNATNRRILETLLKGLGAIPVLACDGHEAVAAYAPGAFDVLFLDISMPGLDGIQALASIRATEAATGRRTPAYAVTANAMRHQIEGYHDAGFDGHIPKPFRKEDLARALAAHVASSTQGAGKEHHPQA